MADPAVPTENLFILNLMSTYGPLLIGALLSSALYGMGCIQLFLYYNHYDRDSTWLKFYVLSVWAFDTAGTLCNLIALWPALILKWGSLQELSVTQPPMIHRIWLAGIGTTLVHLFYIWRIYMVNGRKPLLPGLLIPLTLFQMIESIIYCAVALRNTSLATLSGKFLTHFGIAGRAATAFVDFAIGALMIYSLLQDGLPKFRSSRKMVFKLIMLTINTGAWTAVFAIVVLSLIARYPAELYFAAVDFPLTSLYLNSLLANLNAREYVRGTSDTEYSYPLTDSSTRSAAFRAKGSMQTGEIHIQTNTDTQVKFDSDSMLRSKTVTSFN